MDVRFNSTLQIADTEGTFRSFAPVRNDNRIAPPRHRDYNIGNEQTGKVQS